MWYLKDLEHLKKSKPQIFSRMGLLKINRDFESKRGFNKAGWILLTTTKDDGIMTNYKK